MIAWNFEFLTAPHPHPDAPRFNRGVQIPTSSAKSIVDRPVKPGDVKKNTKAKAIIAPGGGDLADLSVWLRCYP